MDHPDLEETRHLMQLEYGIAVESIANFDDQRGRIKSWTITVAGGLLALAVNAHSWWLGAIATVSIVFFASIDIRYMTVQKKIILRSHELEDYIEAARRGNFTEVNSYIFGIGEAHGRKLSSHQVLNLLRERPQVVGFYVGLVIGTGLATVLLARAG